MIYSLSFQNFIGRLQACLQNFVLKMHGVFAIVIWPKLRVIFKWSLHQISDQAKEEPRAKCAITPTNPHISMLSEKTEHF